MFAIVFYGQESQRCVDVQRYRSVVAVLPLLPVDLAGVQGMYCTAKSVLLFIGRRGQALGIINDDVLR
jgi:hypothetical protein